MPSLASRLIPFVLRLRGSRRMFASVDATLAHVTELQRTPVDPSPPRRLARWVDIRVRSESGWTVYELCPLGDPAPRRAAVYLHGGAWIREIVAAHWNAIAQWVEATGIRFVVPIYPLAPAGTAASVVPRVADLVAALGTELGPANTFLMGDSAGATIALAAAQQLRARGAGPLGHTVLISPALDLQLDDPALAAIAPHDAMLAVPGLQAAARLWAGGRALDDPLVSPLFGSMAGLGPLSIFSGTHDLLHPDALRLAARARAAGVAVQLEAAPRMQHVYPLLPIPEGRAARERIGDLLRA